MVSKEHSLSLAVFYRLIYTLDNFFPFTDTKIICYAIFSILIDVTRTFLDIKKSVQYSVLLLLVFKTLKIW